MRTTCIMVTFLLTLPTLAFAQQHPEGARVYKQHCARCHEADMPTILVPGTIQDLSAERIYEALLHFLMQRHAAPLTRAEKRAVAEYVSGGSAGIAASTAGADT